MLSDLVVGTDAVEWRGNDGVIRQAGGRVAWFDISSVNVGRSLFFTTDDCGGDAYVEQDQFSIIPLGGGFVSHFVIVP